VNFLNKLRNQPVYIRKIILWSTVIVVALILAGLWFYFSYNNVRNFNKQSVIEGLNFPKIENLNINE